jgi:competence protein ComEC
MFILGALLMQVRVPGNSGDSGLLRFTDGSEVLVTAHVIREGPLQVEDGGTIRQRLDVETGQISRGNENVAVHSGLRINIYDQLPRRASTAKQTVSAAEDKSLASGHVFHYGECLRFPAKLYPPRNYRNPGAFDYQTYLRDSGIAALASTRVANIEVLPGFAGSRLELWRTRLHRSIIEQIHALWPAREAALMDAMVIGEDAFINRPTRADFQRSGTYHVLVVSGMNVSILALVTFWFLRRLRLNDLIAGTLTVSLMVAYAWLTALGPPVWRATLMLALYLGARLFYREKSMLNAIGAAALGLMIADPRALFGASFQMTFLCVWLVAAVGLPVLERTMQPYSRGLRHPASLSCDRVLPPGIVQFRLDLRMIAGRLERFFGRRLPLPAAALAGRVLLGTGELLLISIVLQIGLAYGLLLSSRHGHGSAGQHAGGAADGAPHACRDSGSDAGVCVLPAGENSGVHRGRGARGHRRNSARAGGIARRRPPRAHAGNRPHRIGCGIDRSGHDPDPAAPLARCRRGDRIGGKCVLDLCHSTHSMPSTRGAGDDRY